MCDILKIANAEKVGVPSQELFMAWTTLLRERRWLLAPSEYTFFFIKLLLKLLTSLAKVVWYPDCNSGME